MSEPAPFLPIVQPTLPSRSELQEYLDQIWESGIVTTGPITRAFEAAVERKLEVRNAVMVNHGTTALLLAIRAFALSGDVIIPAFTWTATAGSLVWNGLNPILADVTPGRLTLDPAAAEAAITERTSAIMPVNVFGVPPEMDAFEQLARRYRLRLLYDSAQGLGAMYRGRYQGSFADAECFSLSPTKVVTAMEGGLVTTDDDSIAVAIRSMRDSGKNADGSDIVRLGLSGRPSEVHAAVALKSFESVDGLIAARHQRMGWYRELLGDLPGVCMQTVPADVVTTGNYFVIFVGKREAPVSRDALYNILKHKNIQAKRYFYPAIHRQGAYTHLKANYEGRLPVAEAASMEGLALPLFSHMSEDTVERVASAVREAFACAPAV
jgi:dTDP-4-amino-4,6-dideoxygalactose transaminase